MVAGRSGRAATRASYGDWLRRVQSTCNEAGIAFIVDEVFTGFRLARGGACEYFGLQPDLVTYGKTLGGGLPVGVVCGKRHLMRRFRKGRPADICFARGTFNSHPYVMGSMHAFLSFIDTDRGRAVYAGLDKRWGERAASLNARLSSEDLPLEINALSTIWSICHLAPSRYNWMLQYYLRAEGLALSWVGTGRLIFSLAYDDAAFNAVSDRFLRAARAMAGDGWWWVPAGATNAKVRRRLVLEMIGAA